MNVPLLDLKAQYATIREEVREAIDRVCESQEFILGAEVEALEGAIAGYCGVRFALGISSGSDALLVALMAYQIGPGDEVLTTPYTFFATGGVVARVGATPVFVDVEPTTFNMNVTAALGRITPRTKAIIPVHLFGRCVNVEQLVKTGIPVIEDAAQAIGAKDDQGRQAGTVGALGCLSFFPSKNLGGFGDGGMILTQDEKLFGLLKVLRVHGGRPKYHHKVIGGNFRLDALQAAVLRVKLRYLERWTQGRRQNAERYRRLFEEAGVHQIGLPEDVPGHIYNQFIIRAPQRDNLMEGLRERGVRTEIYYPVPLHLQEGFRSLGYEKGDFPHSEALAADSLALPIYPELTEAQQQHVVDQVRDFYRR
jgi:dTDP-4-amino-4,6-dideoxygalactose transaminase